jgi:formate transporter
MLQPYFIPHHAASHYHQHRFSNSLSYHRNHLQNPTSPSPTLAFGAGCSRPLRPSRAARIVAAAPIDRPSGGGARFSMTPTEPAPPATPSPAVVEANGASPQAVVVTEVVQINSVLSPAQIYHKAAEMGAYKASLPWWKIILLGAVAGCYVALGGALLLTVAPNCPGLAQSNPGLQKYLMGAIGFPYALLAILTCGAELFTGNTALVSAAVYEGKADIKGLIKSWVCSYTGNIIGCALGLLLFANTGLLPQLTKGAELLATVKVAYPLKETMCKAVAANWFVCLAVWQSIAANSFGGKFIACLGPVSAFVCIGLEHCIANMFFVPLGILVGANATMGEFVFKNLIPVTLGNIFAGAVLVAAVYSLVYGSLGRKFTNKAA